MLKSPPLPLCGNYTGGSREFLHYVATASRRIYTFLIAVYEQNLKGIICLDNILLSYLRGCDIELKQRQLFHVFQFNIQGITALINLRLTLTEKQCTEMDSFLDKQSFPPALIAFITYKYGIVS